MRDRKTHAAPVGLKPLAKALKQANVPLEYIGNKNRINYFQQNEYQSPAVRQLFERYVTPPDNNHPPPLWIE